MCGFFRRAVPADVAGKKQFLRRRKIALWDIVMSCEIVGASDASIREEDLADVASLVAGRRDRGGLLQRQDGVCDAHAPPVAGGAGGVPALYVARQSALFG